MISLYKVHTYTSSPSQGGELRTVYSIAWNCPRFNILWICYCECSVICLWSSSRIINKGVIVKLWKLHTMGLTGYLMIDHTTMRIGRRTFFFTLLHQQQSSRKKRMGIQIVQNNCTRNQLLQLSYLICILFAELLLGCWAGLFHFVNMTQFSLLFFPWLLDPGGALKHWPLNSP